MLLFLSAEAQGEEVRARIQSAEPLDAAAEEVQKGLRVFVRSWPSRSRPWIGAWNRPGAATANPYGAQKANLVLLLGNRRRRSRVPNCRDRYKVSPQIAGAIKAVPGVIQVEAL